MLQKIKMTIIGNNFKKAFITFFLILSAHTVCCQPNVFRHYDVSSNLSVNNVHDILQDSCGIMWFATSDGINRLGSEGIESFRSSASPEGGLIVESIALHKDGKRIWIGAADSLMLFNPATYSFLSESVHKIQSIACDDSGDCWVAARSGLYIKKEGAPVTRLYEGKEFSSILFTSNGRVIVGAEDGLYCWLKASSLLKALAVTGEEVTAISLDEASNLIKFGTANGKLYEYNSVTGNTVEKILKDKHGKELPLTRIHVIYSRDNTWEIAADNGHFVYNYDSKCWFIPQDELKGESIYKIFRDMEGGIWYGTYFCGVCYLSPKRMGISVWQDDGMPGCLKGNAVCKICEDQDGNFWIATENGGLNHLDKSTGKIKDYTHMTHSNLHALLLEGEELWVGTFSRGLDKINVKTGRVRNYRHKYNDEKTLPNDCVYSIFRKSTGELFIGTLRGLCMYNDTQDCFERITELGDVFAIGMKEDERGNLWLVSEIDGVWKFSTDGTWKNYICSSPITRAPERFISIMIDSNDIPWFGTKNSGLYLYQTESDSLCLSKYTHSLPRSWYKTLVEDGSGNVWISTTRGIVCLDPRTGHSILLTEEDGLPTNQFELESGILASDGSLWFGSVKGICSFKPDIVSGVSNYPVVSISSVDISSRNATIRVNNSSFTAPSRNVFQWQIPGVQDEWISTGYPVITVTGIPPGKHMFRIRCCNGEGVWSKKDATTIIKIKRPLFQSVFAFFLYAILLLSILFYIIGILRKNKKLKIKSDELAEENNKLSGLVSSIVPGMLDDGTDNEKKYLKRIDNIILNNISNPNFNIMSLATELGISRSSLQRIIKSLTGLSPRDYIRAYRLRKATEYLREGKYRIKEVSYMVGFNNLSYFSKCFRDFFGVVPKQFGKKNDNN